MILAGRSNSEEDYNVSTTRETVARTYVVRSRANSPSSERRGSTAGDLVESSSVSISVATTSRVDEFRRNGANNGNGGNGTASNAGNGGGEANQRVTRSQVRLHGAQLDRAAEDPLAMPIHPRKRKLRSAAAKTMIEPVAASRPLVPVVSPSLAAIAVKNSYEAHQHMKKAVSEPSLLEEYELWFTGVGLRIYGDRVEVYGVGYFGRYAAVLIEEHISQGFCFRL